MANSWLNNRKKRPTHPGEILREDVLPAAGLTRDKIAKLLGVSRRTVSEILHERRPVTTDMAHRLARAFGTSPEMMKQKKSTNDKGQLIGVEAALKRAALRAREIAAKTGTPLVIYKNGKIVKLMISPKQVTKASRK